MNINELISLVASQNPKAILTNQIISILIFSIPAKCGLIWFRRFSGEDLKVFFLIKICLICIIHINWLKEKFRRKNLEHMFYFFYLIPLFQSRRFKCEMLMIHIRHRIGQTPSDDKNLHHLWPDEVKIDYIYLH